MDNSKLIKALTDAGYRESALLLKNWDEMDANAERLSKAIHEGHVTEVGSSGESSNGPGYVNYDVNKAGEVKPFNTRIVDEKNNIQRKSGRVGDQRVDAAGKNRAVQQWAKGGKVGGTKAEAAAQAKADKKKSSKNPVKTMPQFSPEEIKAMEDRANAKLKKSTGQWSLDGTETTLMFETGETKYAGKNELIKRKKVDIDSKEADDLFKSFGDTIKEGASKLQPTDEQLFGHLVVTQEQVDNAQEEFESKLDFYNDWAAGRIKTSGEKPEDNGTWANGTSYNSQLSPEELKKRNGYIG